MAGMKSNGFSSGQRDAGPKGLTFRNYAQKLLGTSLSFYKLPAEVLRPLRLVPAATQTPDDSTIMK